MAVVLSGSYRYEAHFFETFIGNFLQISYKSKVNSIFEEFKNSNKGIEDIKDFFYNSVIICNTKGNQKGCLYTNTYNEFSEKHDREINEQMNSFMNNLKELFIKKLKTILNSLFVFSFLLLLKYFKSIPIGTNF